MKVRRLDMTSFRGFRELTLEFTGPMTVLVGTNGAGKTSILDCLAVFFSEVSSEVLSRRSLNVRWLRESDIQYGQPHTLNTIEVSFEEKAFRWTLALVRQGLPENVSSDLTGLQELVAHVQEENARGRYHLPLAIYYPVNRAPDVPSRRREEPEFGPLYALDHALDEGGRNFRHFFEWFRDREDLENEQSRRRGDYEYRDPQLEAVRNAIAGLLPGLWGLQMERAPQRMVILKDGTDARLEINQLSDGEKSLLAMAGDLGRRLAMTNPALENPLLAEAVVMIDEIELHLHPGWQRTVVERLRTTFPNCQFILTTHSPQVLSQVPAESVILLDRFQRAEPSAGTLGRDSNSILTEVMGVPERPEATARRIQEIAGMIDREELPEARRALDELARQLGEHDSEVVRLRSLIGFLDT